MEVHGEKFMRHYKETYILFGITKKISISFLQDKRKLVEYDRWKYEGY